MQTLCLYSIPLFALFNTLLSAYLVLKVALCSPRLREAVIDACADYAADAIPVQEWAEQKFDDGSLHSLLERRYDDFIAALKRRIPMAEMVMTGSLEAGLKEQVQTEISQLLPELKRQVAERLPTPEEVREWVKDYLQKQDWKQVQIPFKHKFTILFSLGAISFSFGLLQLLLFLVFCR